MARRYFEARQLFSPQIAPNKVGPISEQSAWPDAWGQHHLSPEPACHCPSYPRRGRANPPGPPPSGCEFDPLSLATEVRCPPPCGLSGCRGGLSHGHQQHSTAVRSPKCFLCPGSPPSAATASSDLGQVTRHSDQMKIDTVPTSYGVTF